MSNYEATKYDFTGGNLTGIDLVNTGLIIPWSDSSIPSGFLECNGANVSRTTYADLFAVIGTTYGSGDGSSTFGLPDLQDNVPVGKSPTKALASTGGANAVTSSGNISGNASNHSLSGTDTASHTHTVNFATTSSYMSGNTRPNAGDHNSSNTGGSSGHSHSMSATFSGGSDSVLQPYITMIYIIKT